MAIDLGAIAKGFAVKKGKRILEEFGIESAMIREEAMYIRLVKNQMEPLGGSVYTEPLSTG